MYPVRVNIGIMCFVGCLIAYMLRVNLSITLLAMIVPRVSSVVNSTNGNSSMSNVPDVRPRTMQLYSWIKIWFFISMDLVIRGLRMRKVYCWEHFSGVILSLQLRVVYWMGCSKWKLIDLNNLGIVAEWIGGRALVGYTLILSSIFNAAGPIAASFENFWLLFATRFLVGVFGVIHESKGNFLNYFLKKKN